MNEIIKEKENSIYNSLEINDKLSSFLDSSKNSEIKNKSFENNVNEEIPKSNKNPNECSNIKMKINEINCFDEKFKNSKNNRINEVNNINELRDFPFKTTNYKSVVIDGVEINKINIIETKLAYNDQAKLLMQQVFNNPKLYYNVCIFLDVESISNLMLTDKNTLDLTNNNKCLIKAAQIKTNKSMGEIYYLKDYSWLNKKKHLLIDIHLEVDNIMEKFISRQEILCQIFIWSIFILFCNAFIYLVAALIERKKNGQVKPEEKAIWKYIFPLSLLWVICVILLIILLILKFLFKLNLKTTLKLKLKEIGIYTERRHSYLFREYKFKYKNKINNYLLKYLISYFLFWIPFLLNYNIINENKFGTHELLTLGGMMSTGVFYLKELYTFIKSKLHYWTDNKIDKYKLIVLEEKKDFLIEKLNKEVLVFQKSQVYLSEITLSMIFFIFKFIIYVGFILYFQRIGMKIDNPNNISTSWHVFFIPFYLYMCILLLLQIVEAFSYENTLCDAIKRLTSSSIYFIGFLAASIHLCFQLDYKAPKTNAYWVPGLITFSSIHLVIHKKILYKSIN